LINAIAILRAGIIRQASYPQGSFLKIIKRLKKSLKKRLAEKGEPLQAFNDKAFSGFFFKICTSKHGKPAPLNTVSLHL
jgi:hypothetical protein